MKLTYQIPGLLLVTSVVFSIAESAEAQSEINGHAGISYRYYAEDALFPGQDSKGLSLALQGEYRHKWNDNFDVFTFVPFYRWDDNDSERTHGDIRQLDFIKSFSAWEFQAGISKIFWGVTESAHLVDIINQTDAVEHLDGEEKLGQPLVRTSYLYGDGMFSVFVMPYFRERTHAGLSGRLRPQWVVDSDNVSYESPDEEQHVDYALRLKHLMGGFDIGLSYFDGTSRQPDYIPNLTTGKLNQYYPQLAQTGLDLQYTGEKWLWKLEAIYRDTTQEHYYAEVGGFEYTIPGVVGSNIELGLLAEYHYDSRGEVPEAPFQNDLFLGARFVLNDSDGECLIGSFVDLENRSKYFTLEYSTRLTSELQLIVEAQVFDDIARRDAFFDIRDDGYLEMEFKYYF